LHDLDLITIVTNSVIWKILVVMHLDNCNNGSFSFVIDVFDNLAMEKTTLTRRWCSCSGALLMAGLFFHQIPKADDFLSPLVLA
jgi:hypothetical protein